MYEVQDCNDVESYICNPCPPVEFGNVGSLALIKKGFAFTDQSNATEWIAAIEAGDIIILPETNGTFDGGVAKSGVGTGRNISRYLGSTFTLKIKDANFIGNQPFWNEKKNNQNWLAAWITSSQLYVGDQPCVIEPGNPIAADVTTEVMWDISIKWFSGELPAQSAIPEGVFECWVD